MVAGIIVFMPAQLTPIIIIVSLIVILIAILRFMQPRLSLPEQYLLTAIRHKCPRLNNTRLYMCIKAIVHPVAREQDLAFQEIYLKDPQSFKGLAEQFKEFGAQALSPLLGFETLLWQLDTSLPDMLTARIAAYSLCRNYPDSAEVIEELLRNSPDPLTVDFIKTHQNDLPDVNTVNSRYQALLTEIFRVILSTKRNQWWPGTNPEIREWVEALLSEVVKKPSGK